MRRPNTYGALAVLTVLALSACQARTDTVAPAAGSTSQLEAELIQEEIPGTENGTQEEIEKSPEENSQEDVRENGPDLLPINVEITGDYDGEWKENKPIFRSVSENVNVLDEGYGELKSALGEYNETNRQEVKTVYTENLEWIMDENQMNGAGDYFIERTVELQRTDERMLSFWNTETAFLGGAHGSYYKTGVNFDSRTGKRLSLSDVVTDEQAVFEYVKNSLKTSYAPEMFFENYEETLDTMFNGTEEDRLFALEWVMDREKLILTFNPYVLAPWAAGSLEVEIPYAGNEGIIREEYRTDGKVTARKIAPNELFAVDRDGDGNDEMLHFEVIPSEESYTTALRLCLDADNEREGGSRNIENGQNDGRWEEEEYYGSFSEAYLMNSASGHPYLYVEFQSDNDWRNLEIFDLEQGEKDAILNHIGTSYDSIYRHFLPGSERFSLYTRINLLGTYMAYRSFHVGDDGMPAADEEVYTKVVLGEEEHPIVSKREIPVWIDGKREIMPSGTKFFLRKSSGEVIEGETFAEAELPDGRRCEIRLTRDEDQYLYEIDGVSEYDCFESLEYAG